MKLSVLVFSFSMLITSLFSKETTFLLIRHGETPWNLEHRVQGHTDIPLNETGIEQAKEVGKRIFQEHSDVKVIYASDLTRAVQTAKETAKYFQLDVFKSDALREINNGISEGMKIKEKIKIYGPIFQALNEQHPNRKERWDYSSVPEAETFNQLLNRFQSKLIEIAKKHEGNKIAIFTHSKTIKTFLADILDSDDMPNVQNCGVYEVIYDDEKEQSFSIKGELYCSFYTQQYD